MRTNEIGRQEREPARSVFDRHVLGSWQPTLMGTLRTAAMTARVAAH